MTNIKQFNKARAALKPRKKSAITIDSLQRNKTPTPQVHKGGARRGKGVMKIR